MSRFGWRPYVPVAARRARALKKMAKLRKEGLDIKPVEIEGRKIARTFWGEAWCDHLESFSDFDNRLPRGRTYVRNGSVCHLSITKGSVEAIVSGSELYKIKISIKTLPPAKWKDLKKRCAGHIGSLLELLQGKLSGNIMSVVTDRKKGLFPLPGEIDLSCNCPDWAEMCKHVAAVLYGVGARLDEEPELLFLLRGVDHEELISAEADVAAATAGTKGGRKRIADDALADVFGIEMTEDTTPVKAKTPPRRKKASKAAPKAKKAAKVAAKAVGKRAPKAKKAAKVAAKAVGKRQPKTDKSKARVKKTPAPRKTAVKKTRHPARAAKPVSAKPVTGEAVLALRRKFGMSRTEFATLLGISAPSIKNWEERPGLLNLHPRSLEAWNVARKLTKRKALEKLSGL